MWIWNVKIEIEWNYDKECRDDKREYNVAAKTYEKAIEKALAVNKKYVTPWKDDDGMNFMVNAYIVHVSRGDEVDA